MYNEYIGQSWVIHYYIQYLLYAVFEWEYHLYKDEGPAGHPIFNSVCQSPCSFAV